MCGIAGWICWKQDLSMKREVIERMSLTLVNRGPDEAGVWLSPHALLGHRRLTVIDPAGGAQPMVKERDGRRCVIVYNGEIYNREELRRELLFKGYSFQGRSDTEVVLAAYMEWGPAALERLNGIFAFGIWDEGAESLFLARDRLGVKPLFYALPGEQELVFGSELKTLLAHPAIEPAVDGEGLAEVLILGPGRTPGHGIFAGMKELKPGHWLLFTGNGARVGCYWALGGEPHAGDLDATAEKVRYLLQDAVQRQLVSDVPLCTFLSGGVDSTAISALATRYLREKGQQLNTYSVDYVGNARYFQANAFQPNADADWVPRVAAALGTQHHYVLLDIPELAAALDDAVAARDLPGMADIDSSLLLFCREIKKNHTVALSGECADEIFGGYPWFFREEALKAKTFPWMRTKEIRLKCFSEEVIKYTDAHHYLADRYREAMAETPLLPGERPEGQHLRRLQYLTLTRWMPILLDRKDRMSMAVGLEVRVPFCDHRLVEYAWNIPWEMKTAGNMEKGLLRKALTGIVPEGVLQRKKSPYPKTCHPAYLQAVQERVLEILNDPNAPLRPLINEPFVRELALSDAAKMNLPWFGQLMSGPQLLAYLVQVDSWLRMYKVAIK